MAVSPYKTALKLSRPAPSYVVANEDKDRVTAYGTYDDIYHNVEEAFKAILRDDEGDEKSRRLIAQGRTVIDATDRYLAKNPAITPQPLVVNPDGSTIEADEATLLQVMKVWNDFATREEFFVKLMSLKKWMLIRGDGLLHIMGDDTKPEGSRLRIQEVNPSSYFRIEDPADPERLTGVYLVTIINDDSGGKIAARQAYLKTDKGTIFTQLLFFEEKAWDDRYPLGEEDLKSVPAPARYAPQAALIAGYELDPKITSIPVYHFRNVRQGSDSPFGLSELQGIETVLAGIIQTASDEDIATAQVGVGIYVTTSGPPRDSNGKEMDWVVAPASVLELTSQDDRFERVKGIDSVKPLLDHMGMLEEQSLKTTGTPDIAVGSVDVKVAESGIALAIQMAPILGKNGGKELEIKTKVDQLLFDFTTMWAPAYEGLDAKGVRLQITFGDPLPVDRAATIAEIVALIDARLISIEYGQQLLRDKLGFEIPPGMLAQIAAEQSQMLDAVGARMTTDAAPVA